MESEIERGEVNLPIKLRVEALKIQVWATASRPGPACLFPRALFAFWFVWIRIENGESRLIHGNLTICQLPFDHVCQYFNDLGCKKKI
jgi:hypothetical protein